MVLLDLIPDVVVARRTPLRLVVTRDAVDSAVFFACVFFVAVRDGLPFIGPFFTGFFPRADFFVAAAAVFFLAEAAFFAAFPEAGFAAVLREPVFPAGRAVRVVFVDFFFAGFFFDIVF